MYKKILLTFTITGTIYFCHVNSAYASLTTCECYYVLLDVRYVVLTARVANTAASKAQFHHQCGHLQGATTKYAETFTHCDEG
jgi:hypothetical protein